MAGHTLNHRANRRGVVHRAGLGAVRTQEILETKRAVALGAPGRDFRRILIVPVVERFRVDVGVPGDEP